MALVLAKSVFIHVAKTGGTWVTQLLARHGLVVAATKKPHVNLAATVAELPIAAGIPGFAFVRHPVSWWKSYWAYKTKYGWDRNHALDVDCQSPDFQNFMRNVFDRHPGYLSRRLREMTEGLTYIGRFEALRESLIEILALTGDRLPDGAVYDASDANVASRAGDPSGRFSTSLLSELLEKEEYAFRRFGYGLDRPLAPRPPTVWLTGLPSSGKTTLAVALSRKLDLLGIRWEILDGDELRRTISEDLGFSREARRQQARRTAWTAALLSKNGILPIVALVSPYRADRAEARGIVGTMIEVHVDCPPAICEERDGKGLYRRARQSGGEPLTGVNAPYEPPMTPEVHVDTSLETIDASVIKIAAAVQGVRRLQMMAP